MATLSGYGKPGDICINQEEAKLILRSVEGAFKGRNPAGLLKVAEYDQLKNTLAQFKLVLGLHDDA